MTVLDTHQDMSNDGDATDNISNTMNGIQTEKTPHPKTMNG